ncbi:hypothetical protein VC218_17975 [Xanthomonas nasturtii]|nr:hypothetical protein [Xanthomonas nasturtii]
MKSSSSKGFSARRRAGHVPAFLLSCNRPAKCHDQLLGVVLMLCPMAADWGDVATWVSGAAATAAVIVALRTSREARSIAQASRDAADRAAAEERARLKAARDDQAACLAIVFHHELWLLHGQLREFATLLHEAAGQMMEEDIMNLLMWRRPQEALTMLTRLAESLDVFDRPIRALLLTAMSGWVSLRQGPAADDLRGAPLRVLIEGAIATANAVQGVANACGNAAVAILPLVRQTYPDAPELAR